MLQVADIVAAAAMNGDDEAMLVARLREAGVPSARIPRILHNPLEESEEPRLAGDDETH